MTAVTEIQPTRTRRHSENYRHTSMERPRSSRRFNSIRSASDSGPLPGLRGSGLIRRTTGMKTVIETGGNPKPEPATPPRPSLGACIQDTAECKRVAIIFLIKKRFRAVPVLIRKILSICDDFETLDAITDSAITCRTLADFDIMLRRSLNRFVKAKEDRRETATTLMKEENHADRGR